METTKNVCKIHDNASLMLGNCLEYMKLIPNQSVDMILCDPPYGVTKCKWDKIIPFADLWQEYHRITKPNAVVALFASGIFDADLIYSNRAQWRYKWVWQKNKASNFLQAEYRPMLIHEFINIFSRQSSKATVYNPQFWYGNPYSAYESNAPVGQIFQSGNTVLTGKNRDNPTGERYPLSIVEFDMVRNGHPTQKPVDLLEFLIKTYTNSGNLVLDNCMGSGSTGEACFNTGRRFIGIEVNSEYFQIAKDRLVIYFRKMWLK